MRLGTRCAIGLFAFTMLSSGQGFPPAQGPPAPSTSAPFFELGIQGMLTPALKDTIAQQLAEMNATLAARTDYRAKVSLEKVLVWAPGLTQTAFTDRPNHRYVSVPYRLEFKIYDIQWADTKVNCNVPNPPLGCPKIHGQIDWDTYPWDRTVSVSVEAKNFCLGWESGTGHIQIVAEPQQPYLDPDTHFTEDFVNFILGGQLVPFINSKLKQALVKPGGFSQILSLTKCNTLQAFPGDPNTLSDDSIRWSEPETSFPSRTPGVTVRPTRVKRLKARRLEGGILYDALEAPAFEFWSGFRRWFIDLPPMMEEQEVALAAPAIEVSPRLTSSMSLVVVANTFHKHITESNFRVFSKISNYGHGTQKLVISKSYWRTGVPPLNKPVRYTVPAYEVTFEVHDPLPGSIGFLEAP